MYKDKSTNKLYIYESIVAADNEYNENRIEVTYDDIAHKRVSINNATYIFSNVFDPTIIEFIWDII